MSSSSDSEFVLRPVSKKKPKRLSHWLQALPLASSYTRSYRGLNVSCLTAHPAQGLVALGCRTGSVELRQHHHGELQLVRRLDNTFSSMIMQIQFSCDGSLLAVATLQGEIGVIDTHTADISALQQHVKNEAFQLPTPVQLAWDSQDRLVIARGTSVHVYNRDLELVHDLPVLHKWPIQGLAYSAVYDCVLSWDDKGMIEMWSPSGGKLDTVQFQTKSETDLFYFRKNKRNIRTLAVGRKKFTVLDTDGRVVVFDLATAKRRKEFDESLQTIDEMFKLGTAGVSIEAEDFELRKRVESKLGDSVTFDVSSTFLVYPTIFGIKTLNLKTNTGARLYGLTDGVRFHKVCLIQQSGRQLLVETAGAENKLIDKQSETDSAIVTLDEFGNIYLFGNEVLDPRDVELGTKLQSVKASSSETSKPESLPTSAILHTSIGDIGIELHSDSPAAVGSFKAHCKNNDYNGIPVTKVIKNVAIVIGDTSGFGDQLKSHAQETLLKVPVHFVALLPDSEALIITTGPESRLPKNCIIVGRVSSGIDILHTLINLEVQNGNPVRAPIIHSTSLGF